jgi:hypothetical protein
VENRFETFPDPFNNWVVWDRKKNSVAEVGSQILQFLSEARARELCGVLNRQWPALKQSTNGWPPAKILAKARSVGTAGPWRYATSKPAAPSRTPPGSLSISERSPETNPRPTWPDQPSR